MSTITVTNAAQLTNALGSAHGGDVISLAAGNYGDVSISGRTFASDVKITSQNAGSPANLHSLSITGSSHLNVDGVTVRFAPTTSTYAFSPAVKIDGSQSIIFAHSTVTGGAAVNGVGATATVLDATGNVQGMPTGYGVSISNSSAIVVDSVDISQVNKGVVLAASNHITISNDDIHNMRTTGIVGANISDVLIKNNHIHDSNPWHWGSGDHADFLAMWSDATQIGANNNITITNNLMEQGKGTAVLGMWLQGGTQLFTNVTISNNAFLNGNTQGITLNGVSGGKIDHNVMLQTSGDAKAAPGILLTSNVQNISVSDNITSSVADTSKSIGVAANTIGANQIVQNLNPLAANYYSGDLIKAVEAAFSGHTGLYAAGDGGLHGALATAAVSKALAVEALALVAPGGGATIGGTWSNDRLVGTGGNDVIDGVGGNDTLIGGAGDDTYIVNSGAPTIVERAGEGVDTVIAKGDFTLGANLENLVINNASSNNWNGTGNELDNRITGNAGSNFLSGGDGNDTLDGGAGNDILLGGGGNDLLIGGAGKDIFRFELHSGRDVVRDFSAADHDVIDISNYLRAGLNPVLHDVGADVVISFGSGDSITLMGVHAGSLLATSAGFTI